MSMSLRRKMALREQAKKERGVATRLAGVSRAGQVARSTVPVGESDLPVVETLETVVDTAETLPGVIESADQAGSDAYDAAIRVDEAQAVADGAAADALAAAQAAAAASAAAADAEASAAAASAEAAQAAQDATDKSAAAEAAAKAYALAQAQAAEAAAVAEASGDATAKADAARLAAEAAAALDAKAQADAAEAAAKADAAAAQATADAAASAAGDAQSAADSVRFLAEGLYQAIPSVTAPTVSPSGPLKQGDMWFVIGAPDSEVEGKFIGVQVWDGAQWVPREALYDSILVVGEDGTVRIADNTVTAGAMATDALDFKTARGMQLYAGYIEAPTIASSDRLGTGANVLNDPGFTSSIDTAWVASGHLGDAAVTQRDTIVWDQTWKDGSNYRAHGNVVAEASVTRGTRTTGSMTMPNYGWMSKASRSFTNPFDRSNLFSQSTAAEDPNFAAVEPPALLPAVARTTYLTNSSIISVEAGQRWNIRLSLSHMADQHYQFVTAVVVEVVSVATGDVVYSHSTNDAERRVGSINVWWDAAYTGTVRYRIKATYSAGGWGDTVERKATAASFAKYGIVGGFESTWMGNDPLRKWLTWGFTPQITKTIYHPAPAYVNRVLVDLRVTSAVFAQVEPSPGWRLDETEGLEMFDSLGARTVKLDGEDNYFTGRIGTAESGERWELEDDAITLYDEFGQSLGAMKRAGAGVKVSVPMSFHDETAWANAALGPNVTGTARWRRYQGVIYVEFNITSSTTIAPDGLLNPAFTLPLIAQPGVNSALGVVGQGTQPAMGTVSAATGAAVIRNLRTVATAQFFGSGNWLAP